LLLASDAAHFGQKLRGFDELVLDPLMIAPLAIVTDENRDGCPEVFLTQDDQPIQTLFLDRAHKPFSEGVALRNAGRANHNLHAGGRERFPKGIALFGIPVNDQVRFAQCETVPCVHELTRHLSHPLGVGRHGRAAHANGA